MLCAVKIIDRHPGEQKLLEMAAFLYVGRFDAYDLSRKKLTAAVPAPVSKPPVITGLAQVQNTAHLLCRVDALAFDYEQVSFTRFYFLRSFAKKPSASLRMSFAVRSSDTSRSSSRMRIVCSSALGVFAGGVFRRMLRQSASV